MRIIRRPAFDDMPITGWRAQIWYYHFDGGNQKEQLEQVIRNLNIARDLFSVDNDIVSSRFSDPLYYSTDCWFVMVS